MTLESANITNKDYKAGIKKTKPPS